MILPREPIQHLTAATHGGIQLHELERLGLTREEILDFSVSANPFMPPSSVVKAAHAAPIDAYPDSRARRLQHRLAELNEVSPETISVVNGTSQALWLIALAYLRPGDKVLTFPPTYGDYRMVSSMMGAESVELRSTEAVNFRPEVSAAVELLRREEFRIVWLCNPNNPTSTYLTGEELAPLLRGCRETDTLLVLDEAYANFNTSRFGTESLVSDGPVVLLRSMTKDYNLNALRLGYTIAPGEVAAVLDAVQPPWSVNTPAEEAGLAALEEADYYRETWKKTEELTEELGKNLETLGFHRFPVGCNFQLFKGPEELRLAEKLWERGIKIRDCTSFGLPGFFRVGTRSRSDNRRLVSAIEKIRAVETGY